MSQMSLAPFDLPVSLAGWGLALRDEEQHRNPLQQQPSASARAGPAAVAAESPHTVSNVLSGGHSRLRPRPAATTGGVGELSNWERAAVDVYRLIRRHRREGTRDTRTSADVSPPLAALMVTAFPQLVQAPSTSAWLPTTSPLLLHYLLLVGYPHHPASTADGAATSYPAALVAAADKVVHWFGGADGAAPADADVAPHAISAPVRRFGVALLPDVVQQVVAAHQMSPSTAAAWLLRVFVGLLAPEEAREHRMQLAVMKSGAPDPTVPPWLCTPALWSWAEALCSAVYQLQGAASVGAGCAAAEEGAAAREPETRAADCGGHREDVVDWRLLALTVLQRTTTLLLRGCVATATPATSMAGADACVEATDDAADVTDRPSATQLTGVLPAAPTSRVAVEGLAYLALLLRLHPHFPSRRGETRDGVSTAAQAMARKHWEAHTHLAVRQLPHLPLYCHHIAHIMDVVLDT